MAAFMKLGSSFVVPAERSRVFAHFLDPDSMRACIPGCSELERVDETHYRGRLVNEIAHVRFSAGFSAEITGMTEPEEVRAVLKGEDRRLASSIRIDALLSVRPVPESPEGDDKADVSYKLDLAIRGKIGRMGESIIRRRSAEVERQFVEAFTRVCAGEPVTAGAPATAGPAPATPQPAPAGPPTLSQRAKPSWWRRLLGLLRPSSRRSS
jgi:carbon monoxide dehydrogenase subunit G